MVHFLILVEGYPNFFLNIIEEWKKKRYRFTDRRTGQTSIGAICPREVRLYDFTIREEMIPAFLSDLKSLGTNERKKELFDFDLGLFKKIFFNQLLSSLGFKAFKMPEDVKPSNFRNGLKSVQSTRTPAYFLVLAKKTDPFDETGREMG